MSQKWDGVSVLAFYFSDEGFGQVIVFDGKVVVLLNFHQYRVCGQLVFGNEEVIGNPFKGVMFSQNCDQASKLCVILWITRCVAELSSWGVVGNGSFFASTLKYAASILSNL